MHLCVHVCVSEYVSAYECVWVCARVCVSESVCMYDCVFVFGLFFWVLWHINLCMLLNVKSIFMKIVLFQTIQFNISTQFNCKYGLIVKNISISSYSV